MPPRATKRPATGPTAKRESQRPIEEQVETAVASLRRLSSTRIRDEMGPRYGIHTDKAFGVSMANMKAVAKRLGRNHELAAALWETGWYEARMVAAMVDEPDRVSPAQMDRWCSDFDNWGICDTVCFVLFDRTPHAFAKVAKWAAHRDEFIKRAAFALLACVALHDKQAADVPFLKCLPLIERAAADERNFVKKGVSWALRAVGRRSPALHSASLALARRLAASPAPAPRWVGRDALREFTTPGVVRRFAASAPKNRRTARV